jgi:hypothetical protein
LVDVFFWRGRRDLDTIPSMGTQVEKQKRPLSWTFFSGGEGGI